MRMNPATTWGVRGGICPCAVQAINSHFLFMQPLRWRSIISSRGYQLGEDTDFPLGPNRHWCRVTLFLLCYQQQTCLHALIEPASASLCRSFKAFAPGKQDKNGSGFHGMQTGMHLTVSSVYNQPYSSIQARYTCSDWFIFYYFLFLLMDYFKRSC